MNIESLVAVYGPAASSGLGSAVFTATGVTMDTLEAAALARYREFVGGAWDERSAAWRSGFGEIYRRSIADAQGICAELHALQLPALRGVVQAMVDDMEDPGAARAALAAVFDDGAVRDVRLYAIGDGEAMAGVAVGALDASGDAVFLVLLLD